MCRAYNARIYRNKIFVTFCPDPTAVPERVNRSNHSIHRIPQLSWRSYLVVLMRDTNEFFEEKAQECTELAYAAGNKADREFWLRLARRWEVMRQPRRRKHTQADGGPLRRKYGLGRFTKWHISAG